MRRRWRCRARTRATRGRGSARGGGCWGVRGRRARPWWGWGGTKGDSKEPPPFGATSWHTALPGVRTRVPDPTPSQILRGHTQPASPLPPPGTSPRAPFWSRPPRCQFPRDNATVRAHCSHRAPSAAPTGRYHVIYPACTCSYASIGFSRTPSVDVPPSSNLVTPQSQPNHLASRFPIIMHFTSPSLPRDHSRNNSLISR